MSKPGYAGREEHTADRGQQDVDFKAGRDRIQARLGVQPGELVLAVLLDTGGAPDLAARRTGNRPGRY